MIWRQSQYWHFIWNLNDYIGPNHGIMLLAITLIYLNDKQKERNITAQTKEAQNECS